MSDEALPYTKPTPPDVSRGNRLGQVSTSTPSDGISPTGKPAVDISKSKWYLVAATTVVGGLEAVHYFVPGTVGAVCGFLAPLVATIFGVAGVGTRKREPSGD